MRAYFGIHNHTCYSNIRLLDCINRPTALIDKAIDLGLSGIAITDHECLSAHMEVNQYAKKIKDKHPDFVIALGNEIYLTDTRDRGQKYYHFILIAKDAEGHKALREMSTQAWRNSYVDRKMERVPLLKSELADIMSRYKGHVIATTACIGGELGSEIILAEEAEAVRDYDTAQLHLGKIHNLVTFCKSIFGEDFYLECAPSTKEDQIQVNRRIRRIGQALGVKVVVGTDAHYLTKAERQVHKAYLNSKNGEREVDDFYATTYMMSTEELESFMNMTKEELYEAYSNIHYIKEQCEDYSLLKPLKIPQLTWREPAFHTGAECKEFCKHIPWLEKFLLSDYKGDRLMANLVIRRLVEDERLRAQNIYDAINECLPN